jgi:hypothetical protein
MHVRRIRRRIEYAAVVRGRFSQPVRNGNYRLIVLERRARPRSTRRNVGRHFVGKSRMRHTDETPTPHYRHRATDDSTQQSPRIQHITNPENKSVTG